jgi:hypothetical protein
MRKKTGLLGGKKFEDTSLLHLVMSNQMLKDWNLVLHTKNMQHRVPVASVS